MSIQSGFPADTPFAQFNHCPQCGSAPLLRHDLRAIRCADCDFIFYFNCASATAAFIIYQGKLLLSVRGEDPQKGMLDFPGGFVEFDETVEDALAREIQEELNITISSPVYLTSCPNSYQYANVLYKTTDLYFICNVHDISTIKPMDDVSGYVLITPSDIDPQLLAFPSGRMALQRFLDYLLPIHSNIR